MTVRRRQNRERLTAIEVGCDNCAWTYTTDKDRQKKAEARAHTKATGHSTWANSYYTQHFSTQDQHSEEGK